MFHLAVLDREIGVIKSILAYEESPLNINGLDRDNMTALDIAISL